MECEFVPGQKVVCINDNFNISYFEARVTLPKLNEVYTIRDLYVEDFIDGEKVAVYLKEILNEMTFFSDPNRDPHEMGFAAWRFRPLNEQELKEQKEAKAPFDFKKWLIVPGDKVREIENEEETV